MTDLLVIAKAIHKDRNPTRNWDFEPPTMKDFYKSCAAAAIAAIESSNIQRASFVRGELGNIEADRAMTSLTKPKPVDPLNRDEAYSDKLADNFRGWP
jgi:hypothetical protein